MTVRRRGRLTRSEVAALPVGPVRTDEERRLYFHDVDIASRIRIHRELDVDDETCPWCPMPKAGRR